jgi:hypothetical protein
VKSEKYAAALRTDCRFIPPDSSHSSILLQRYEKKFEIANVFAKIFT